MNLKIATAILKKMKPDEMEDLGSYFAKHYPTMYLEELAGYTKRVEAERDKLKKKCDDYKKAFEAEQAKVADKEIPWPAAEEKQA